MNYTDAEVDTMHLEYRESAASLPGGGNMGGSMVFHDLHCIVSQLPPHQHAILLNWYPQLEYLPTLPMSVTDDCPSQKHLHRYLYSSHYFPSLSQRQLEDQRDHLDHCLDMLRVNTMCRADMTPIPMCWGEAQSMPISGGVTLNRQCVDWESVVDWAQSRDIPRLLEPGWLQHPKFGPAYNAQKLNMVGAIGILRDSCRKSGWLSCWDAYAASNWKKSLN